MVFIVRARLSVAGQLQGVITHAASGRREPFADAAHIGALIAQMSALRDATPAGIAQLDAACKDDAG